ncbi:MAG: 16S rRNA (guanine(527)-N(7))-methyltransferase RsmG [Eubacteriales bacterium]|nr:16S rRNA (guanine(527)-N(7))-methyltransferase RsmG [Eubacteriales bacterium]
MTGNFAVKVRKRAGDLAIDLTDEQLLQLNGYYEMLVEKNKVMNLTAITEEDDVITKHIIDSLSIVKALDKELISRIKDTKNHVRLIDIGTGAGLPGLILKIVFPAMDVTLFDSLKKRLVFLDEVIEELSLKGTATVHGRAEDYGRNPEYREKYDIAVSRAVANMSSLSEYCLPFVKKNGLFAAYKSADSHDEIAAAKGAITKLGGKTEGETVFTLPDSDIERRMVLVRKIKNTPSLYPRKAGVPSKDPLK